MSPPRNLTDEQILALQGNKPPPFNAPKNYSDEQILALQGNKPAGAAQQPQQTDPYSMEGMAAFYQQHLNDRADTPDPATDTMAKQMAAVEAAKRANQGLAWLHAGAAMLQNTTPFASVALGKGIDAYATSKEVGQAAEQAGLAHIAQQQGEQYKTQMAYQQSVDATKAHVYGLNFMRQVNQQMQLSQQAQAEVARVYEQNLSQQLAMIKANPRLAAVDPMSPEYDMIYRAADQRAKVSIQGLLQQLTGPGGSYAGHLGMKQASQPQIPTSPGAVLNPNG
jgi:hypothetical protein